MNNPRRSAANNENCDLAWIVSSEFHTQPFHAHDQYEIFYFIEGSLQYYIEEKSYMLMPGDVLLIPPGWLHRPVVIKEDCIYQRVVLMVHPDYAKQLLKSVPQGFVHGSVIPCHLSMPDKMRDDFQHMLNKMLEAEPNEIGNLIRDTCCTQILILLEQLMQCGMPIDPNPQIHIQHVISYLNAHFLEPLTLDNIAEKFHVSKYHLLHQFKFYTDSTIHNYILAKRILLAKALMKQGFKPQEVCFSCGFGSYGSFYQAFKKMKVSVRQFGFIVTES